MRRSGGDMMTRQELNATQIWNSDSEAKCEKLRRGSSGAQSSRLVGDFDSGRRSRQLPVGGIQGAGAATERRGYSGITATATHRIAPAMTSVCFSAIGNGSSGIGLS